MLHFYTFPLLKAGRTKVQQVVSRIQKGGWFLQLFTAHSASAYRPNAHEVLSLFILP
jgi:hypothetical protein